MSVSSKRRFETPVREFAGQSRSVFLSVGKERIFSKGTSKALGRVEVEPWDCGAMDTGSGCADRRVAESQNGKIETMGMAGGAYPSSRRSILRGWATRYPPMKKYRYWKTAPGTHN